MSVRKFILVLILIAAAGAGGYFYGFYKSYQAQKQLLVLQQKLEQAELRLKILVDVKQKLERAQAEIAQKNFGLAKSEMEAVQAILLSLESKADPGVKKKLEELNPAVKEIIKRLSDLDFSVVGKIEELKVALEKIARS
jgi:uncharacterized protein HemX